MIVSDKEAKSQFAINITAPFFWAGCPECRHREAVIPVCEHANTCSACGARYFLPRSVPLAFKGHSGSPSPPVPLVRT